MIAGLLFVINLFCLLYNQFECMCCSVPLRSDKDQICALRVRTTVPAACSPAEEVYPSVVVTVNLPIVTVHHSTTYKVMVGFRSLTVAQAHYIPLVFRKVPCALFGCSVGALVRAESGIVLEIAGGEKDFLVCAYGERSQLLIFRFFCL